MPSGIPNSSKTKPCEICFNDFKYFDSTAKKGHARFCSITCQKQWQSISKKGKKPYEVTETTKSKFRAAKLGKPNPSKGIPRPSMRKLVHSSSARDKVAMRRLEYRKWRSAVFARDNYTCQICNQYGVTLHADHIIRWKDNEELRLDINNGRTLCVPCHYYITFKRKMKPGTNWCNFMAKKEG